MSDEILPALMPDEWHTVKLWRAGKMIGGRVRGMVVLDLPDDHVHGAAACALYGQPFGFTHEDVRGLRNIAAVIAPDFEDPDPFLLSLADRIAALLPPNA